MSEIESFSSETSPQQSRAIVALMTSKTIEQAAIAAEVSPATLYRWLAQAEFKQALRMAETQAVNAVIASISGLAGKAFNTLEAVLNDPEAAPAVKVTASKVVLDYFLKLRELDRVEARLEALEIIHGNNNG